MTTTETDATIKVWKIEGVTQVTVFHRPDGTVEYYKAIGQLETFRDERGRLRTVFTVAEVGPIDADGMIPFVKGK